MTWRYYSGCWYVGCDRPHHGRGLCAHHYRHYLNPIKPPTPTRRCDIPGCNRRHFGRGYCRLHHDRNVRGRKPRHQRNLEAQQRAYDTHLAFLEEVEYFRSCGYTDSAIARRLGYTKLDSYQQYLRRAQRNIERHQQQEEAA